MSTGGGIGMARHCAHCNTDMPEGPDACLGVIPGAIFACCGHGNPGDAYVVLANEPPQIGPGVFHTFEKTPSVTLRGDDAVEFFAAVKRGLRREANDRLASIREFLNGKEGAARDELELIYAPEIAELNRVLVEAML